MCAGLTNIYHHSLILSFLFVSSDLSPEGGESHKSEEMASAGVECSDVSIDIIIIRCSHDNKDTLLLLK